MFLLGKKLYNIGINLNLLIGKVIENKFSCYLVFMLFLWLIKILIDNFFFF